jgi:hypothetical protein
LTRDNFMSPDSANKAKQSRARSLVILMTALVGAYICFAMWRAVLLMRTGTTTSIIFGCAVLVIPLIGMWVIARELFFGYGVQTMATQLEAEGGLTPDTLPHTASGRIESDAADAAFAAIAADTEAHPSDWRSWFRLGVAYDDARDRKRARSSMRTALKLYRDERIAQDSQRRR